MVLVLALATIMLMMGMNIMLCIDPAGAIAENNAQPIVRGNTEHIARCNKGTQEYRQGNYPDEVRQVLLSVKITHHGIVIELINSWNELPYKKGVILSP